MKKSWKQLTAVILAVGIGLGSIPMTEISTLADEGGDVQQEQTEEGSNTPEVTPETGANTEENTSDEFGKCGENVYWSFNKNTGELNFSGTGDMYDYKLKGVGYQTKYVKSVNISPGITSIGDEVLLGCEHLNKITIPDSVTEIGNSALADCKSLTYVKLPENLNKIGQDAFFECLSLNNITFPSSLSYIDNWAFSNCTSLTSITIPNTIKFMGLSVFGRCTALKDIKIFSDTIVWGTFWGCTSLKSITIPNTIKNIGQGAFESCTNLESIFIPSSVVEIDNYVFDHDEKLTIYGQSGSYAQQYANDHKIPFIVADKLPEDTGVSVQTLSISPTFLSLQVGGTQKIYSVVTPESASGVTWSSSDENIAIVSDDGIVTGKAEGRVVITAKAGDAKAECVVIVSSVEWKWRKLSDEYELAITCNGDMPDYEIVNGVSTAPWRSDMPEDIKNGIGKLTIKLYGNISKIGKFAFDFDDSNTKDVREGPSNFTTIKIPSSVKKMSSNVFAPNDSKSAINTRAIFFYGTAPVVEDNTFHGIKASTPGAIFYYKEYDNEIKALQNKTGLNDFKLRPVYVGENIGWPVNNSFPLTFSIEGDDWNNISYILPDSSKLEKDNKTRTLHGFCYGLSLLSQTEKLGLTNIKNENRGKKTKLSEYGYDGKRVFNSEKNLELYKVNEKLRTMIERAHSVQFTHYNNDMKILKHANADKISQYFADTEEAFLINIEDHAFVLLGGQAPIREDGWIKFKTLDPNRPQLSDQMLQGIGGFDMLDVSNGDYGGRYCTRPSELWLNPNNNKWRFVAYTEYGVEYPNDCERGDLDWPLLHSFSVCSVNHLPADEKNELVKAITQDDSQLNLSSNEESEILLYASNATISRDGKIMAKIANGKVEQADEDSGIRPAVDIQVGDGSSPLYCLTLPRGAYTVSSTGECELYKASGSDENLAYVSISSGSAEMDLEDGKVLNIRNSGNDPLEYVARVSVKNSTNIAESKGTLNKDEYVKLDGDKESGPEIDTNAKDVTGEVLTEDGTYVSDLTNKKLKLRT